MNELETTSSSPSVMPRSEGPLDEVVKVPEEPPTGMAQGTARNRPSYVFLGVVSAIALVLDLGTKLWDERRLEGPEAFFHPVELIPGNLDFVLAKNRGGAWGLLQDTPELVRRPFFLLVSALAI